MFLVKAGTLIQVETQNRSRWDTLGWRPYVTKEDELYDKHEVWDAVAVHNDREDVPEWARRNIKEYGYTVICRDGKYAMVRPDRIEFVD